MKKDSMWPDVIAALIITAGLFVGSLGVLDAASAPEPIVDKPCRGSFGQLMPDKFCEERAHSESQLEK